MTIRVTATDIAEGDCAFCPVERGFAREGLDTMVGPTDVSFFIPLESSEDFGLPKQKRYVVSLPLPRAAQDFIKAFDALPRDPDLRSRLLNQVNPVNPVSLPPPFEFEMAIPTELLEPASHAVASREGGSPS